jgi:hypothetical protein
MSRGYAGSDKKHLRKAGVAKTTQLGLTSNKGQGCCFFQSELWYFEELNVNGFVASV